MAPRPGRPDLYNGELPVEVGGWMRSTVLDAEGGLWLTTSNKDGVGTPGEDDDKVLRILPPTVEGSSPL